MPKIVKYLVPLFLIFLFLFLRFYHINNSFFFFNDLGRDMLVLQQWQESGKPPLLGPQTSALPINQSALYFYMLYPGYLISQGHPFSSHVTLAIFYITTFFLGIYLFRKDKTNLPIILVSFFIIAIHPQYIIQSTKFVWNPSFVTPFIIASLISFYLLQAKYSLSRLLVFSLSLATAISLSYSVAPLLIAYYLYWLIFSRQKFLPILLSLLSSFFLVNLPTIFFELRHHFLLTTSLFTKSTSSQSGLDITSKINSLSLHLFSTNLPTLDIVLLFCTLALSIYLIYKNCHYPKNLQFISAFLFLALIPITLIIPINVQAHYIFAFTSLIFVIISTLSPLPRTIILLFFAIIYLQPKRLQSYFAPASRTLSQMEKCFTDFCHDFTEPTFVSVQSNFHPFHNGPEHRYLMEQAGCQLKNIETENGQAKYMSVVLDDGNFDSKTNYYELELFGKYQEFKTYDCQPNFKIKVLLHL